MSVEISVSACIDKRSFMLLAHFFLVYRNPNVGMDHDHKDPIRATNIMNAIANSGNTDGDKPVICWITTCHPCRPALPFHR